MSVTRNAASALSRTRIAASALSRVASAPGKLVVAGEYSVLEHHPAWVAAANRRALCEFEIDDAAIVAPDDSATFTVAAKGRETATVVVGRDSLDVSGKDAPFFALAAEVLRHLHRASVLQTSGAFRLDSSSMSTTTSEDGQAIKLGLGSSAAVSAAMVCAVAPQLSAAEQHRIADAAHLAFSKGHGSGVDVAASCIGGHLLFQRAEADVSATPFSLTRNDFVILPVFVGHAQDTRAFLGEVNRLKKDAPEVYAQRMSALKTSSQLLIASVQHESAPVFDAVIGCFRAMGQLGVAAKIDIVSAPHVEAAKIAHAFGGAAKPSGAGGGDVSLVFVPTAARERAAKALAAEGLVVLPLGLGAEGARLETDGSDATVKERLAT